MTRFFYERKNSPMDDDAPVRLLVAVIALARRDAADDPSARAFLRALERSARARVRRGGTSIVVRGGPGVHESGTATGTGTGLSTV